MNHRLADATTHYIGTNDAAQLLGLSPRTLEKYRCHGNGPIFRKLGGRVVYAISDIEDWVNQSACRSTSDPHYVTARSARHGRH